MGTGASRQWVWQMYSIPADGAWPKRFVHATRPMPRWHSGMQHGTRSIGAAAWSILSTSEPDAA